ncbi:unnamed protein product [Schistosoma curassoni]|uniref:DUF6451 domain-containing protein n=1 Tax=Schistosoma curassoni TaxID=6186 RepID=A0A183JMA7_9TREM|nr:unnamed protein product [Schistosoma curassoni]
MMAIRQIKGEKAAAPDNTPAEALNSDIEIWVEKQVPLADWREEHLIKIPKKGDLNDLAHTHQQIQVKKVSVAAASASVGLDIHKKKSKVLKYSTESISSITLDREVLKQVKTLTFLGIINEEQRESDADVKEEIDKTRTAFLQLKNVWNSKQLSSDIKVRIFSTNVKTVPLIFQSRWPDRINNNLMLQEVKQLLAEEEIRRRSWRWVVHTVWESSNCITKQALTCSSEGK